MKRKAMQAITVSLNGDQIEFSPACAFVNRGDAIVWKCPDNLAFAIHFGWNSPLDKNRYRTRPGGRIQAMVPAGALHGKYKYFAALYDGENIWTEDPELIVRR